MGRVGELGNLPTKTLHQPQQPRNRKTNQPLQTISEQPSQQNRTNHTPTRRRRSNKSIGNNIGGFPILDKITPNNKKGQALANYSPEQAAAPEMSPTMEINEPVSCPKKGCQGIMYYRDKGDTLICFLCSTSFEISREELKRRLK